MVRSETPDMCQLERRLALRSAENVLEREELSGRAGAPPLEPPLLRLRWRDAGYQPPGSQQRPEDE